MQQNIEALQSAKPNFITLNSAKKYLRVNHIHDDEMIKDMLDVVCAMAENYIGIKLSVASWKISIHGNLPSRIKLLKAPINKIESFKIYKNNGEISYLSKDHYDLYENYIWMKRGYITEKSEIIYSVGYKVEELPAPIKQGMLEHLAKIYDMRGSDQALPLSAKSLYQPYKIVRF